MNLILLPFIQMLFKFCFLWGNSIGIEVQLKSNLQHNSDLTPTLTLYLHDSVIFSFQPTLFLSHHLPPLTSPLHSSLPPSLPTSLVTFYPPVSVSVFLPKHGFNLAQRPSPPCLSLPSTCCSTEPRLLSQPDSLPVFSHLRST